MAKTTVSGFAAKLGKAGLEAFNETKDDEIVVGGGGECPPIPTGVAQLVDIHLGEYESGNNKGETFVYLGAVVISPKFVTAEDGSKLPAAGCRTSLLRALCETTNQAGDTKSLKENMAAFSNDLKKLGLDTASVDTKKNPAALDAAIAALVASKPYFRFSVTPGKTSPQYPNPRLFHNWGMNIPDYADDTDPDAGVVETPVTKDPKPITNAKKTATSTKPDNKPAAKKGAKKEEVPFGDDLDMTADKADAQDEEACAWMIAKALELGYEQEEIDNTDDWQQVAQMIRDKESGEATETSGDEIDYDQLAVDADADDADAQETIKTWSTEYGEDPDDHGDKSWVEFVAYIKETYEADAETAELVPEKGKVYEAVVGKNKKPSQIEVLVVKPNDKTANVKSLEDNKVYPNIPWSALSEVA